MTCHIEDLLYRFTNEALQDTCARVGGDPARKLSAQDRLIGAAALVQQTGEVPVYIAVGAAAGLYRLVSESGQIQNQENGKKLLLQVSGLEENGVLADMILQLYKKILTGCSIAQLRGYAEKQKATHRCNVI